MNFYISRLIIWFEPEDKPQELNFLPNKVNVITGNSSTGKSNIIAIINYCLLSEKSNIVEPVINQFSKWYGLEFKANGIAYSIARKRPDLETITSDVYIQEGFFDEGFYPSSPNYQIQGGRRFLNSVLGFHNNRKDFRFRSNFIFNILTENIITSPYDYLNVNFFETKYLGKNEFRQMLVDETITPKGLNVEDLCLERKKTSNLIARYDKREVQIKKVQEEVDFCISLLEGNGFDVADIKDKEVQEQVSLLRKMVAYVKNTVLRNEEDADNDLDHLKQGVMEDSINLHNLLSAKKQYEAYLGTLDRMEDALKPIEFLQKMKQEGFFTMWTDYIVSSLSKALSRIVDEKKQNALDALKFDEQINAVRMNIETKQKQIRQASALKQAIYQQAQSFRAIGVVEEKLKILNFNDDMKDKTFKLDNYDELVEKLEKLDSTIKEKEQANYTKWQTLDDEFQSIYDKSLVSIKLCKNQL